MKGFRIGPLLACVLAVTINANAQAYFASHTGSSDQYIWVAAGKDSFIYYAYSYSVTGFLSNPYESKIYKRDSYSGLLTDSIKLSSPFGNNTFVSDLKIVEDTIFALINVKNGSLCAANMLIRLDLNLSVLDTIIKLNSSFNYPELLFMDLNPDNNDMIYLFGHLSNNLGTGMVVEWKASNTSTYLLNGTGTILGKQKLPNGHEKVISWSNAIFTFDSTFVSALDTTFVYSSGFNIYAIQRKSQSLYFAGDASGATVHSITSEGLLKMNDSLFTGYKNYPVKVGSHSIYVNDSNEVYLVYVSNSTYPVLSNQNQWITTVKMNPDGSLVWKRHFMGDADYHVYSITEAPNKGIFVFAARYDWTTQNNERDLYIYKIDKNGSMLGTPALGGLHPIEVIVYPNPFQQQLEINFLNQTAQQATLTLLDVTGKMIQQQEVDITFSDTHTLNTQNLPAGIYVLSINDSQGNVLHRQKVVKQ